MYLTRKLIFALLTGQARFAGRGVLSTRLNKSDVNDAEGLAQLARTGWYKQVHIKDRNTHLDRTFLRVRHQLVKSHADMLNQLRGRLKKDQDDIDRDLRDNEVALIDHWTSRLKNYLEEKKYSVLVKSVYWMVIIGFGRIRIYILL